MKKIAFRIILVLSKIIGQIQYYILSNKCAYVFNVILQYIYSQKISLSFCSIGNNNIFKKPTHLIGGKYIKIGNNNIFGHNIILSTWDRCANVKTNPVLSIGDSCNLGDYNHISCANQVTIGNGVLTGRWVTITDNSHGEISYEEINTEPNNRPIISKGKVIIEDNVWIGDKATILPGVTIGKGCIVAANSVVTKEIPNFCVVAGCPAKIIKILK